MEIEIKLYSHVREAVGKRKYVCESDEKITVKNALCEIGEQYPEFRNRVFDNDGEILDTVVIRKNNQNVTNTDELISGSDSISITTQVVGG